MPHKIVGILGPGHAPESKAQVTGYLQDVREFTCTGTAFSTRQGMWIFGVVMASWYFVVCSRVTSPRHGMTATMQHCVLAEVENYMRWIPMCGDGLFWAAKWEVFYDSWGSVKRGKRTDQIIQSADSVELKALWLSVQCAATMAEGTPIQALWRPRREANPTLTKAQRRTHGAMLDWEPQEEVLALCDVPVPVKEPQEVPQDISHWPSLGEANDIDRSIATAKRLGSITRKQSPCARRTASSSPSSTPPSAAMPDPICEEAVPVPRRWDKTRIVSQA